MIHFPINLANEVRTIKDNQVLIVSANRNPVLLDVTPWYENSRFKKMVAKGSILPAVTQGDDRPQPLNLSGGL